MKIRSDISLVEMACYDFGCLEEKKKVTQVFFKMDSCPKTLEWGIERDLFVLQDAKM